MPTIKDVAKSAGVSVATVSAVINNNDKEVSQKVKFKIKKLMEELDYRPNRIAQALSRRKSRTIGYIIPSVTNQFFPQLAKGVEDMAFNNDYGLYLCNTDFRKDRLKRYMQSLIESKVSGIIITMTRHITESDFISTVQRENIPIVGLLGARIVDTIDTIAVDDFKGGKMATEYLIQCGHTNIGFIGSPAGSKTNSLRLDGYMSTLKTLGLKASEKNVKLGNVELGSIYSHETRREGQKLTLKLMNDNPAITGIFAVNDIIVPGIFDALDELGRKVPDDVSVIGFDNSIASLLRPNLTTMALPSKKMATLAMDILFGRINGDTSKLNHIKLAPELIKRASTK